MPIRVKLPNGKYGQFPDGTPHEEIESVLQKQFPPTEQESEIPSSPLNEEEIPSPKQIEPKQENKSLASKSLDMFSHALDSAKGLLKRIPDDLKGIKEEFGEHPFKEAAHALGQFGVGATESLKGIANLGLSALTPLSELGGMPEGAKPFKYQIPEETGLQKSLGLESNKKGDTLLKEIPDIASLVYGGSGLIKKGLKELNTVNPLSKESKARNALTEAIIKQKKAHEATGEKLEELKEEHKRKYGLEHEGEEIGTLNAVDQENSALRKEAEIKKLQPHANVPEKHVGEIPTSEEADKKAASIINDSKHAVNEAKIKIEEAVEAPEEHKLRAGTEIKKHIDKVKSTASKLYNSARAHYVDKKILADNGVEIKAVTKDLDALKDADELAPGYGIGTADQKALEDKLAALKGEKVKASDVFDMQRTLEKMAKNTRDKQFSSGKGMTDSERTRLGDLAERFDKHADALAKRLESIGGKDVQAMVKQANVGWRTYKNFERDTIGKKILKSGKIVPSAMYDLTGTEPNNAFINALIENNPALRKDVLASQFVNKGKVNTTALAKPDKLTAAYLKHLPKVDKAVNDFKIALAAEKEGKGTAKAVIDKHQALIDSMTKEAKIQATRKASAEQITKLEKQVKFQRDAIAEREPLIEKKRKQGKNVAQMEEDLARRKREYSEGDTKLTKLKSALFKTVGAKGAYELLFKNDHHSNN